MIARVVLALLAVGALAVVAVRGPAVGACEQARRAALGPTAQAEATADDLLASCRGSQDLGYAAGVLASRGAVAPAERLARATIAREPEERFGWAALTLVLRARGDDAGAAQARRRALALDPRFDLP